MRILVITQYFWPENFRINDLVKGLMEKGHEIEVLTGMPNYPSGRFFPGYHFWGPPTENFAGITIRRVPLLPRGKSRGWQLVLNFFSFAFSASLFGPLRCRGHFDLIFVYEPSPMTVGLPALMMKKVKSCPILFWIQDLWPESLSATGAVRSKWILNGVASMVRFIFKRCDRILVQSKAFIQPTEDLGVSHDRIYYFPNSAEALYQPLELEEDAEERSRMPVGFKVMFAGNIGAAQDFETILSAAEYLREHTDIHWIILGDGRKRSWVETEINQRGLTGNVHLLGSHPMESMPRFFSLADVMLVTLKKDPIFALTIPAKLQSYLACGKPIIAALDGEGSRIIQEADAGLTSPAENSKLLAENVKAMYRLSMAERTEIGIRGRKYFEEHFERVLLLKRLDCWMQQLTTECTAAS
jgi:colanic acid biosynthesis glycosyl transferase WcaI